MPREQYPIIPCSLSEDTSKLVSEYARQLAKVAPSLMKSMTEEEFWRSGIFHSAVERIRGQRSASMKEKRDFMASVLDFMKQKKAISDWEYKGTSERFDYVIQSVDGKTIVVETKGCLDGNNTNIFQRPPHADEFYIWSLCQNSASDPRKNAWSGIHTRLSAEIVARKELVSGVIIWDMLCGTIGRPCPKLARNHKRATKIGGLVVPPPCIYVLPKTLPDPRNNPSPNPWEPEKLSFVRALFDALPCDASDIVQVRISTRMDGADVERRTTYHRTGSEIATSNWTKIKRTR